MIALQKWRFPCEPLGGSSLLEVLVTVSFAINVLW